MIIKYDLHDSLVEGIKYLQDEAKLMLEIELCNWRQPSYQNGEPEMLKILITFTGVRRCEIEPEAISFESDEILEVTSIISDIEGSEAIKIVLRGEEAIKIVKIIANDVVVVNR